MWSNLLGDYDCLNEGDVGILWREPNARNLDVPRGMIVCG